MRRALNLAVRARHASPNPAVGCVLAGTDGMTLGEGWTQPPGQAHAEIMALRMAGTLARGTTAYVTLEPCAHHGRTPPCAEALLEAGVREVFASIADPNPQVAGLGFARLEAGGVIVAVGLLESEARALNAAYLKYRLTGLPWVTLKTAMTLDGKIATRTGQSQWITAPIARAAVHRQLRDRCDAILTGVGTVVADDPSLTTRLRHKTGRNPLRVVVDSRGRTPLGAKVVLQASVDGKTLIAVTPTAENVNQERLRNCGCEVVVCAADAGGRVSLPDLLARLGTRGDTIAVLVESGGELAEGLIEARLVDRWLAFIAPKIVGGRAAPGPVGGHGVFAILDAVPVRSWRFRRCGPDLVIDARFG